MNANPVLRTAALDCGLKNPSIARRLVRDALQEADRDRWADSCTLAVSELVTNALLHARPVMSVRVEVGLDQVRVTVTDGSTDLPARRDWGTSATTGRGLALVSWLAADYGVVLGLAGKDVWFTVDDAAVAAADTMTGPDGDPEAVFGDWDTDVIVTDDGPDPAASGSSAGPGGGDVILKDVPVVLWRAAQQQYEAVLRELYLYQKSDPYRLDLDLATANRALGVLAAAFDRAVCAATAAASPGDPPGNVDVPVPVGAAGPHAYTIMEEALDQGLRLAAEGRLLIRPSLPEVVALRGWAADQVTAQDTGKSGIPWPGFDSAVFVGPENLDSDTENWGSALIDGSARAEIGVRDNNRIVAVSASAAALLRWDARLLVGRRVTVIIPVRFREAHVAGFTRHLTTGETRVVGTPLELPVLRGDGTELLCQILLRHDTTPDGRLLFVARIEPDPAPGRR